MACNKNKNMLTKESLTVNPSSVEFVQIAKGNLYGNGSEQIPKENLIITNNVSWEKLLQKMNLVNGVSTYFNESNIYFKNYIVLAIFDEIKRNGGHTISIKNIVENKNNLIVTMDYGNPNGDLTEVITQPFQIVKIPKTLMPIQFE
jgi:hypothetical protein